MKADGNCQLSPLTKSAKTGADNKVVLSCG